MSPLLFHLLRRIAVLALVLTVVLGVGWRLATELGLLGPSVDEVISSASNALEAARVYGADASLPEVQAAERELQGAREHAQKGEGREARRAAARATEHAVAAQRVALGRFSDERRRAEAVVSEIDRLVNDLEEIYSEVTPGLPRAEVDRLVSLMKSARRTGASLVLAYEQGRYQEVLEGEDTTRVALLAAQEKLRATPRPALANGQVAR
jgi:hypothetical protein